ncbi:MAG: type II toxin-antitoxin system RelE/ParE family toxin [Xanthomonadales bacterium]|nr:type II toxin-antitoxin system RelE/ParE family toxin [Xanthomonadales bacterium]
MIAKPVYLTAQARREVRQTTDWYKNEGGAILARRWVAAVEDALGHISAHAKAGSTRYSVALKLDRLRFWPIEGFPYLVFYIEQQERIDVGRVLHKPRDIPAWMGAPRQQSLNISGQDPALLHHTRLGVNPNSPHNRFPKKSYEVVSGSRRSL